MIKAVKKFQNASPSLKATIVFGISSFATSGINYITTPIFTRLLSTEEYGTVAIYNSWMLIMQVVLSLTLIYPGVLHVGLYEHSDNRWRYLSVVQGIITSVSVLVIGLFALFHEPLGKWIALPQSLMWLMLIYCMFHPATTLWMTKQKYEYRYRSAFFVTVGSAVFAQIVSVFMVMRMRGTGADLAVVRLWSAGLVNLIVAWILWGYIFAKGRTFYDSALWKATIAVAVPLIPHYLSHVVLNGTDKIMIGHMVGRSSAGIYSLAATLSSIGILCWRALLTSFSPFVNAKLGERKFREIREAVKPLWMVTGGMCIVGALLSPEIIRVFGTKSYLAGLHVVPAIVASIFMHTLYDAFSAVSFFHKKSVRIMTASVAAAVSNIVMNYFGIKWFGFIAAGYTTLIANTILVIMHYRTSRIAEKEEIYDGKFVLAASAIVIGGCLACNLLFDLPSMLRYIAAAALLIVMFLKRRILTKTLSDMKV